MLYTKCLLADGNFYIKHNFGAVPTIDEYDMLSNESYSNVMNKIQYYATNISGTNSYWYQIKQQLKSMLEQVGSPTIFFTLSCAEFHWPEFHDLFGDVKISTNDSHRRNVVDYPHILDWFFTQCVEEFI